MSSARSMTAVCMKRKDDDDVVKTEDSLFGAECSGGHDEHCFICHT